MDCTKIIVCTIADSNYYAQVLTLFDSINRNEDSVEFHVLSMDNRLPDLLYNLDIQVITFDNIEGLERILGKEKFFYATPLYIEFLLKKNKLDVLYVDADTEFLAPFISHSYQTLGVSSTLMVFHGYKDRLFFKHLRDYGNFNVGFNLFRNNQVSKIIVEDWKKSCRDYFKTNNTGLDFFSDQIYLDTWQEKFGNHVKVAFNEGLNISPRVIARYGLSYQENKYYCGDVLIRHIHYIGVKKTKSGWLSGFHDYIRLVSHLELNLIRQYIIRLLTRGYSGNAVLIDHKSSRLKQQSRKLLWTLNRGKIEI